MEEKTKVNKNKPKDGQDRNNKMSIVKNLLDKGKKNGVLTYQEILDEVENIDLSQSKLKRFMRFLNQWELKFKVLQMMLIL